MSCCCCSAATGRSARFSPSTLGIVFAFRWTGAALACAVMGFPLMVRAIRLSIEAVDRRLEDAAGDARRQPRLGVRHRHAAADPARHHRRHDPLPSPARSASSARPSPSSRTSPARRRRCRSAIYTFTQVPGGDAGALRLTLVSSSSRWLALLASEAAGARADAARRRARDDARASTSSTGSATSRSTPRSRAAGGLTALFGRSGAGKTSLINVDRRADPPGPRPHRRRRRGAGRHRPRRLRAARIAAASAMCSRKAGCSRI